MNININALKINDLTDARFFAAANVKYIGFDFYSENAINIDDAIEIKNWLQGVDYVLMFNELNNDLIFEYTNKLNCKNVFLTVQQISKLNEDYKFFTKIKNINEIELTNNKIVDENLTIEITNENDFNAFYKKLPNASYHLNLEFEKQKEIITNNNLKNLTIYGEKEQEVGIKNYDKINDLFDWLFDELI